MAAGTDHMSRDLEDLLAARMTEAASATGRKPGDGLFKDATGQAPRTALDKTSAAARDIIDTENRQRADRTAELRAARLERDKTEKK
ncbi:hypothetical protein [Sagittula salina]|uniref:Uncharacterized protein n=1 Tax=Sagittula salina TaxID=2820268 RepID=A0A940MQI5_9RHOB|nr:hypothetical protein [Sagittula salina]MBP0483127.1 hypothetical protein [Sagittula salina]